MQANTGKKEMDKETRSRVRFTCFMIPYFAEACKMDYREAYLYLKKYGGLDFIREHWWVLHTDNPYYAALDILEICRMNGGHLV